MFLELDGGTGCDDVPGGVEDAPPLPVLPWRVRVGHGVTASTPICSHFASRRDGQIHRAGLAALANTPGEAGSVSGMHTSTRSRAASKMARIAGTVNRQ